MTQVIKFSYSTRTLWRSCVCVCATQITIYLSFLLENGSTDNDCYRCVRPWLKRPSWDQLSFPQCAHKKITLWFGRERSVCKVNDCLLLNLDSQLRGVCSSGQAFLVPPIPHSLPQHGAFCGRMLSGSSDATLFRDNLWFCFRAGVGFGCHSSCPLTPLPVNQAVGLLKPSFSYVDAGLVHREGVSLCSQNNSLF